jgi:hypothetical protein
MHWIKKWRLNYVDKYGRKGLSQEDFARMVRKQKVYCAREGSKRKKLRTVGCSEVLIEILEHGGITHPNIAEAIATVCGATEEQKYSIMHEKHWSGYVDSIRPQLWGEMTLIKTKKKKEKPKKDDPNYVDGKCKAVVQLDRAGNVEKRFAMMSEAAKENDVALSTVSLRCNHQIGDTTDEYCTCGRTWRFEDEWNALSEEQRKEELMLAKLRIRKRDKKK